MVTDRHHELIQIYRDTFDCDKALFRLFLDASDWPLGPTSLSTPWAMCCAAGR